MKALVLTSTSLRHQFFVKTMSEHFSLCGALTEPKKNYYTEQQDQSKYVKNHFQRISKEEEICFAEARAGNYLSIVKVVPDINDANHVAWAASQGVDIVLLFGTSILRHVWLSAFPDRIVNLHLGLSPFYRGSATLFWPFYYREIECLGTTIHIAEEKVDAGKILRRVKPDLVPGDNYYAITTRLIKKSIEVMPHVVKDYLSGNIKPYPQEHVRGRLSKKADFSEETLRRVLDYSDNGLTGTEIARINESTLCRCLL